VGAEVGCAVGVGAGVVGTGVAVQAGGKRTAGVPGMSAASLCGAGPRPRQPEQPSAITKRPVAITSSFGMRSRSCPVRPVHPAASATSVWGWEPRSGGSLTDGRLTDSARMGLAGRSRGARGVLAGCSQRVIARMRGWVWPAGSLDDARPISHRGIPRIRYWKRGLPPRLSGAPVGDLLDSDRQRPALTGTDEHPEATFSRQGVVFDLFQQLPVGVQG
jgi:hypothetical protein